MGPVMDVTGASTPSSAAGPVERRTWADHLTDSDELTRIMDANTKALKEQQDALAHELKRQNDLQATVGAAQSKVILDGLADYFSGAIGGSATLAAQAPAFAKTTRPATKADRRREYGRRRRLGQSRWMAYLMARALTNVTGARPASQVLEPRHG
jgi:hypothetical protein